MEEQVLDAAEREWWEHQGYLAGKQVAPDVWVVLARMIETHRLMLCSEREIYRHYCYPSPSVAGLAYVLWTGEGDPLPGWMKAVDENLRTRRVCLDCGEERGDKPHLQCPALLQRYA